MSEKRIIRSACRMCHGVCRVIVHLEGDRVVKITGDKDSPTNEGYICPKGVASPDLLYHPDRILHPMRRAGKRGENKWEMISWDDALDEMTEKLKGVRDENGSEYFALMQGTGRPYESMTARFCNAFGTPNFTNVAHVCYFPRVMANTSCMGHLQLPLADVHGFSGEFPSCIVIWGCNVTETHASDAMCGGIVKKAIKKAKKVIVVDPRRIGPAMDADHWLQLRPGTDGALALAMLHTIIEEDLIDHHFVKNYTIGFEALVEHVREFTPEWAEPITRIAAEAIRSASRTYALSGPACIQWGNAIDHSACNFHTARSLLILRAITGNIDRPGGDVVWDLPRGVRAKTAFITPKWGGSKFLPREKRSRSVDGNRYPVLGMNSHAPSFWRSIVTGDPYRIKAFWIMGANPLVTMTHSLEVEKALKMIEYIVVSDFFLTPTAQFADLFLPASTWLEFDEIAQMGGLQWCVHARRKVCQVGDTRDDQEVMIQVARRLGLTEEFPWKDHRALCDWMLEETGMNFDEFADKGLLVSDRKYYKYKTDDRFFKTPSGKFEIYSPFCEKMGVSPLPVYREPPRSPLSSPGLAQEYPLILTSGAKIPVFFHSEFRQIDSLRKKNPDPLVEIHPETASSLGIADGDWVWIETPEGRIKQRARFFDGLARDVVSAQHAWWFPEEVPPEYSWKKSSVNLLHGDMGYDPDTGSESLRSALCKVYKV